MDKFFKYILNNKSNSNVSVSNDTYISYDEYNNKYSSSIPTLYTSSSIPETDYNNCSSMPSMTKYISSQEFNNIHSSSMPSMTEYIPSQEFNSIYSSSLIQNNLNLINAPIQVVMDSNHYSGVHGINQTYATGLTGTNQSNIYTTGYTGTNQSNINTTVFAMHGYTGTNQSYVQTFGPSGTPFIGPFGYSGMSGTNQSCYHKHALYDKIKLVIKNELIFFEVLPNDNSRVYIFNYKGITKKVILKINPKSGEPYANLKFMELVQILDDIRLNDENSNIKKAINSIIKNDPFISNKIFNKIKITI